MLCITIRLVDLGPAVRFQQRTLVEQLCQSVVIGVAVPLVLGVIHNLYNSCAASLFTVLASS